ncbi:hypothetical protein [Chlorobium ferrooxidans]|uniref:Uncharacterized protein n=1 Tax=Chlorobium ferrooxidans DSM 13031 TaxID=377431 RepID=Q0YPD7_9CHLB|nr:hypothetical protein [Chlorobium ferrooxidans]EAT58164.1 hypothetical protein CferDRAFT_0171 [Chlorobium ferrooxidans DSM 13031]
MAIFALPHKNTTIKVDGDDVALTYGAGEVGYITISLSTAQAVTWWKAVDTISGVYDQSIGLVETQDADHGPKTIKLAISKFTDSAHFVFWKAKFLGIHTPTDHYYFVPDELNGKVVGFDWKTA